MQKLEVKRYTVWLTVAGLLQFYALMFAAIFRSNLTHSYFWIQRYSSATL